MWRWIVVIGLGIAGAVTGAFWMGFAGGMLGCITGLFISGGILVIGTSMKPSKD